MNNNGMLVAPRISNICQRGANKSSQHILIQDYWYSPTQLPDSYQTNPVTGLEVGGVQNI